MSKNQPELPLFFPRTIRLTETQFLIWFSAWLDTEGSITLSGVRGKSQRVSIAITQKNPKPLKVIHAKFGGRIRLHSSGSRCYRWELHGERAVAVLRKIANYLVVKKDKAINVIDYYELKSSSKPRRRHHGFSTSIPLLSYEENEKYRELVNDQRKRHLLVAIEPEMRNN